MTIVPVWEVWEHWYDMDSCSPSSAMRSDLVARFSNENSAKFYRDELDYHRLKTIEEGYEDDEFSYNRWFEKDHFEVVYSEIHIADTIAEVEGE